MRTISPVPPRGTRFCVDLRESSGRIAIIGVLDERAVDTAADCLALAARPVRRSVVIDLTAVSSLGERAVRRLVGLVSTSRREGADVEIDAPEGSVAQHALDAVSVVLQPRVQEASRSAGRGPRGRHLQLVVGSTPPSA